MSGIIGHTTYAMLAAKEAQRRELPVAPIIQRHFASYLAGSYLGSDIQTLPGFICRDSGQPVGYCGMRLPNSPITGGPLDPWTLKFKGTTYSPAKLCDIFYGRGHLVFGWRKGEPSYVVSWDRMPQFLADVVCDAVEMFGSGTRPIAYVFGWLAHIVGDSLIKSVQPGVTLHLLDGKYTPRNRPIQDLVCFHEVGRSELKVDWRKLLDALVNTPVEPIQCHFMRVAPARGKLAKDFPDGWTPERRELLLKVMAENRRYQRIRNARTLKQLELRHESGVWQCSEELSRRTGGLSYREMVDMAGQANFRHALWQIGQGIAEVFEQVCQRQPAVEPLRQASGS